jgi:hypothetical protein
MSTSECCRTGAIINFSNAASAGSYVEAFLNNATSINSSPNVISPASYYLGNNGVQTIPFQTIDLESDSIAYEWYQPQDVGAVAIAYGAGYSLASPLGSTGYLNLNPTTQTLKIAAANIGRYQLALRIKDYRNGILVGYSTRDFMVTVFNATNPTNPLAALNSSFSYNTCPGMSNAISLTINDSTATDSVYLSVTTPTIPGFAFNVTNSNGLGSSTTNITWTTPSSFNPATMPNFYIGVMAKDNACPLGGQSFYTIKVNTAQCNTDSVWAGDANGDWSVTVYDPLAIAVAYGKTGVTRPAATTNWQAEFCNNWVDTFANGVNMKHADCNGDGVVDTFDLNAVYANYGDWHLKQTPQAKTTNAPDLYFDISGIAFVPGATVNIPIKLGTTTNPMNNIYGIAGKISLGGITLAAAPQLSYIGSWLGNTSNTLNFAKNNVTTDINWALSRRNHQNASGNGTIAWLKFAIPTDAGGQTLALSFANTKMVDKTLQNITTFNTNDTSVYIQPVGIETVHSNIMNATVVPNPSHEEALVRFTTLESKEVEMIVMDMTGKTINTQHLKTWKGSNLISLPTGLSAGVYVVKLNCENEIVSLKWMKE